MSLLIDGGCSIAKIKQVSERILDKMIKEADIEGVNTAQTRILIALKQQENVSIHQLSKQTLLGKTTLTSMLDRLEKAGFIARQADAHDRRKAIISITPKGLLQVEIYAQLNQNFTDTYYAGFSETDLVQFQSYLERILANLVAFEETNKTK